MAIGIVLNLISNAVDHGAADSNGFDLCIELKTSSVRFTNATDESKSKKSEKGFGLEIVQKLAEATDAQIRTAVENHDFVVEFSWEKVND